jgi:hypothetical protein
MRRPCMSRVDGRLAGSASAQRRTCEVTIDAAIDRVVAVAQAYIARRRPEAG